MHFYSGQFQFTNGFIRRLIHWRASQVAQWYRIHLPVQEMQETRARSLSLEDPLDKEMAPTQVLLPGKFHVQGSLVSFSPWVHRVRHYWSTEHTCTYTHTHSRPLKAEEDLPLKLTRDTKEIENEPNVMILQDSCFEALSARKGCIQYSKSNCI